MSTSLLTRQARTRLRGKGLPQDHAGRCLAPDPRFESMKYSKLLSLATASYGVFALVRPRHLADNLEAPAGEAPAFDLMAYTYAGRDLSISGLALASGNPSVVTAMMVLRILGDLADATILGTSTSKPSVQKKVVAATVGWAALNTAALVADRRALNG